MVKSISLVLFYIYAVLSMFNTEPSGFMMMMNLMIELVLLLLVYVFFNLRNHASPLLQVFVILLAALPVLFIPYYIALKLGQLLGEFNLPDDQEFLNPLMPLQLMAPSLISSLMLLTVVYGLNIYDFVRRKLNPEIIHSQVIYQTKVLILVGFVGLLTFAFFGAVHKLMVIGLLAGVRILYEYFFYKRATQIVE